MLVKSPIETLLKKVGNRYSLTYVVARRARQLVAGANPMAESDSPNLVTLACEELAADRVIAVPRLVEPFIPLCPETEAQLKQSLLEKKEKHLESIEEEDVQTINNFDEEYLMNTAVEVNELGEESYSLDALKDQFEDEIEE